MPMRKVWDHTINNKERVCIKEGENVSTVKREKRGDT